MDEGEAAAVWVHQRLNRDELWPLSAALSVTDTARRAGSSVISRSHGSLGLGKFLRGGGVVGVEAGASEQRRLLISTSSSRFSQSVPALLTPLPLLSAVHFSSHGPASVHPSTRPRILPSLQACRHPSIPPSRWRPLTGTLFGPNSLPSFLLSLFPPPLFLPPRRRRRANGFTSTILPFISWLVEMDVLLPSLRRAAVSAVFSL